MKTFLFRSMIGIFFGAFLSVVFTYVLVLVNGVEQLDSALFLRNSLGTIFCGWFFTVSPLYFEAKSLRLSQQTALHFITVTTLYFILAFAIGWIPVSAKIIVLSIIFFLITYAVIWTCFYLYFRNEAKKLNEELKQI